MNICDLCNAPLGVNPARYTAYQIRQAVKAGLRPNSSAFELGAAFGMSKAESEKGWVQQVMSDNTDWLLCNACVAKYKHYAYY